jgi:transcriptional regulator with XRE-family HTH domain
MNKPKPWDEVVDPRAIPAMRWWREIHTKRTQAEVAEAMGLHRSTYNQIEKGRQPLTYRHLRELVLYYGVDDATFLGAVSGAQTAPAPERPAQRTALYGEMLRCASAGLTDDEVQLVKALLTSPMVAHYLERLPDDELPSRMAAVVEALVFPALGRAPTSPPAA